MSMRFTEIGQQLRAYRLESGLRAEEIAARLGVSRAALYRYEKGEVIKLDTIKRLAELLKISPLSLLGIGVEYYNRPIGYFERVRQIEETADQVLQLAGPLCYLTTSDAFDNALSEAFEETADQEVMHAFGHLDLLYPKASMTPAKALQIAIDGETYEYTEMYPGFRKTAEQEGNAAAHADGPDQPVLPGRRDHSRQVHASLAVAGFPGAGLDQPAGRYPELHPDRGRSRHGVAAYHQ